MPAGLRVQVMVIAHRDTGATRRTIRARLRSSTVRPAPAGGNVPAASVSTVCVVSLRVTAPVRRASSRRLARVMAFAVLSAREMIMTMSALTERVVAT